MSPVQLRGVTLGGGRAKVIVPVTGTTVEELVSQTTTLVGVEFDIIEWRVDFLDVAPSPTAVLEAAARVRAAAQERPVLFTFRTHHESGNKPITSEEYRDLNIAAIESGLVDAVDVEHHFERTVGDAIIAAARKAGVPVVGSLHDFTATPPAEDLVRRLVEMQERGCAVAKVAVTPRNTGDVLQLMEATWTMTSQHSSTPVLTMSMGGLGLITRLSPRVTGSCATFAMVGRPSAPGQIPVEKLQPILELIDANLS